MQKKLLFYNWVFVVTEPFNITVNDFNAKKSAYYSLVLIATELVASRTQCTVTTKINIKKFEVKSSVLFLHAKYATKIIKI